MLSDHIHTLSKAGRTVEWELGAALSGEDIAYLCPLGAAGEASSLFSTRTQTYARTYMHTHVNAHTHTHTNRHTCCPPCLLHPMLHRDPQMPTSPPKFLTTMLYCLPHKSVLLSVCCSHVWWGALCCGWGGAVSKLARALCRR